MHGQRSIATGGPLRFASAHEAAGFVTVLRQCAANEAFLAEHDRLTGSNLRLVGGAINAKTDLLSAEADVQRFAAFVYDVIWTRLPADARTEIASEVDSLGGLQP